MEQGAEPIVSLNAPALQATHSCPSPPVYPALHKQSVSREDPWLDEECAGQLLQDAADAAPTVDEYLPAMHSRHGAEPFDILKVPAMHAEHAPPSFPEYPGSHVHFMMPLLPAPELEPDGHSVHIDSEVAAMLSLYFPR